MTTMEALSLGGSTTAIGMLVVFVGLIILIICISLMTSLTGKNAQKPAAPKEDAAPVQAEAAPAPLAAAEETDEQLIAVISAAIAAVWQGQGSSFVVRRVTRIQNTSPRARAARTEQIYSRM